MDFLTLVGEVHRESGSGGTAPTTLTGLRGENERLKNWTARAYLEIQEKFSDWKFLWNQHSMAITAGTALYNPLLAGGLSLSPNSNIGEYDRDTFFIGTDKLEVVDYLDVKSIAAPTTAGAPWQAVIMPDDGLRIDPIPDADATLTFDYWSTPVGLTNDDDEPVIPLRFHQAIIGKALIFYANYENAPEIRQTGEEMYMEWMQKLEADQLPGDRYQHVKAEGGNMVIEVE